MKWALLKDILREIGKTKSRFLSIFLIVALGCGFFAGVKVTGPDMTLTGDRYFDESRLMDIHLVSTYGFNEKDLQAIADQHSYDGMMPSYSADTVLNVGDSSLVVKVHALPMELLGSQDAHYLNRPVLVEGRFPQQSGECVVEHNLGLPDTLRLGETIVLSSGKEKEDILDTLQTDTYQVVGVVESPSYITYERGTSAIGNGTVSCFVMVPDTDFSLEVYTDIYLTFANARQLDAFSKEYDDLMNTYIQAFEEIGATREKERYREVMEEAQAELADAKRELAEGEETQKRELADARKELDDGWKELEEGKQTYYQEIADAEAELADARQKIADGEQELLDGEQELLDARKELDDGWKELEENRPQLEDGWKEYYEGLADYEEAEEEAAPAIEKAREQLRAAADQLNQGQEELQKGEKQLKEAQKQLESGWEEFEKAEANLHASLTLVQTAVQLVESMSGGEGEPGGQGGQDGQSGYRQGDYGELLQGLNQIDSNLGAVVGGFLAGQVDAGTALYALGMAQSGLEEGNAQLEENRSQLQAAQSLLDGKVQELEEAQESIREGQRALMEGQKELREQTAPLREAKEALDQAKEELDQAQAEFDDAKKKLEDGERDYTEGLQELEDGKGELEDAKREYADGYQEYLDGKAEGWQEILDGQQELEDGEREYQEGKEESDQELADAREEIADAEKELKELKKPVWYVFDRNDNPGYSGYGDDAQRVDAIAQVFPLFFFVVAVLVCLTTMTRMVEEERVYIGTMKALGYGRFSIMSKFLLYAVLAGLSGAFAGLLIGFKLFPEVIYNAYRIMYTLPDLIAPFHWDYALLISLGAAAGCVAAVLAACSKELALVPAALMRPKAPKMGKRVLLERIPFLWRRMSFLVKVTVRNLFRYKKRIFMTVLGISGCTALMLTGFGLRDSILEITGKQFGELSRYDAMVIFDEDGGEEAQKRILEVLDQQALTEENLLVYQKTMNIGVEGQKLERETAILVPADLEKLPEFVTLRDRLSQTPIPFGEEAVVLSEKMASLLGVKAGDAIYLKDTENIRYPLTITAVTENYAGHYLYVSPPVYQKVFGREAPYNMVLSILEEQGKSAEDQLSTQMLEEEDVLSVRFTATTQNQFEDSIGSLNYVILVLILSAGSLAFVVLYNLANINITERIREIATIKVLGFYDKEVSAYIYRENIVLTAMGIVAGLFLGIFLHRFVILTAEIDSIMFGRKIQWMSYLLAGVMTALFSALVNYAMHFRLKKVSMVESLKSVE